MKINKVFLYYYSPTKTTEKILNSIAEGINTNSVDVITNNLTYPEFSKSIIDPQPDDLVILAGPVYAGRIAKTAMERLEKLNFSNNLTVLVAVYGNRDFDDSLMELNEFARKVNLKPVAAAAFIGEHSYSTYQNPIGHNRPDAEDLKKAKEFGQLVAEKLEKLDFAPAELKIPGKSPLPERRVLPKTSPETIPEKCVKCGICETLCPTGAIYYENGYKTHPNLCTLCFACVKGCKHNARVFRSEHLDQVRNWLLNTCKTRKEPAYFF